MKKWIVGLVAVLLSSLAMAQPPGRDSMASRVESMKVAYLTTRLDLSPESAQAFWPLYNQFTEERRAIGRDLAAERRPGQLSDAEVEQALENMVEREQRMVDLHREYMDRFLEVLSPRQVLLLFSSERNFNRELLERIRRQRGEARGQGRSDRPRRQPRPEGRPRPGGE